jgi:hypothetical protein
MEAAGELARYGATTLTLFALAIWIGTGGFQFVRKCAGQRPTKYRCVHCAISERLEATQYPSPRQILILAATMVRRDDASRIQANWWCGPYRASDSAGNGVEY